MRRVTSWFVLFYQRLGGSSMNESFSDSFLSYANIMEVSSILEDVKK